MSNQEDLTKRKRFSDSLKKARSFRKDIIEKYLARVKAQDALDVKKIPVDYGRIGDIERDVSLLLQLMAITEDL